MANTIAHLAVALRVLNARPELVSLKYNYYIGTLAPDTIGSKIGAGRDEKRTVHLRAGIRDKEWLKPEKMRIFDQRIADFVRESIVEEDDPHHRDFSVGYLVHLLTDKVNHQSIRQIILKALVPEGEEEGNWNFIPQFNNELEAMDCYLIRHYPELSALFYTVMEYPVQNCMPGQIEAEFIEKSLKWWKNEYVRQIAERTPEILKYSDIEDFIAKATDTVLAELDRIM